MTIYELRQIVQEKNKYINAHLETIYYTCIKGIFDVYDIFKNYFKEENVDLQEADNINQKEQFILTLRDNSLWDNSRKNHKSKISTFIKENYNKCLSNLSFHTLRMLAKDIHVSSLQDLQKIGLCKHIIENVTSVKYNIIVHFPKITITNEYDATIDIEDLWVKVPVTINGKLSGTFSMNRSTYSVLQFTNNYMHSHVRQIPKAMLTEFEEPCLGLGPIKDTIVTLCANPTSNIWRLFCVELDAYVRTESIAGGPWHRMESLTTEKALKEMPHFFSPTIPLALETFTRIHQDSATSVRLWEEFIRYFIHKKLLSFRYVGSYYTIAMSYIDYMTAISNTFIEWYNLICNSNVADKPFPYETLLEKSILFKGILKDGYIYRITNPYYLDMHYEQYIGKKVLEFKGNEIKLSIHDNDNSRADTHYNIFLHSRESLHILDQILNIVNYRYGTKNIDTTTSCITKAAYKEDQFVFRSLNAVPRHRDARTGGAGTSAQDTWYI